jgi:predicted alpha/beta hydrolase
VIIKRQSFTVDVQGHGVQGTTFTPPAPRGNLIIQSAIGVNQRQYASFAAHLAQLGFRSITYDYSGTGTSNA